MPVEQSGDEVAGSLFIRFPAFFAIIFLFYTLTAGAFNNTTPRLLPSFVDTSQFEIGAISFKGNSFFSSGELLNTISSKESSRGLVPELFFNFYLSSYKKKSLNKNFSQNVLELMKRNRGDLHFFNYNQVQQDSISIWSLYYSRSFHDVKISFSFRYDPIEKLNRLSFLIDESKPYTINRLCYTGLDSLPDEVEKRIKAIQLYKPGSNFDENLILYEASKIQEILINNGYYNSEYDHPPEVIIDSTTHTDSITVTFHPGRRYKIGHITFIDSTRKQQVISSNTKKQMLEFKVGDWYSKEKFTTSVNNFQILGLFDVTKIDTGSSFAMHTDSSLSVVVFNQYRKQEDANMGVFVNRTPIENTVNLGLDAEYVHKNAMGKAQVFNPYGRVSIQNVNQFIENLKNADYEILGGIQFGQPLIWVLESSRVGVFANLIYSYRTQDKILLSTTSFPIRFPIKLPQWTVFNNISIDFTFERQSPTNFGTALKNELINAPTIEDSNKIRTSLRLYGNLDAFLSSSTNPWLTANLFGISISGDHRDNISSPNKGYFVTLNIDGWNVFMATPKIAGNAKFLRFQTALYNYSPFWGDNNILASKFRFGITKIFDEENSYVPVDRQFFAGGANSVRGWSSRALRYSKLTSKDFGGQSTYDFLSNFVGSASILEMSLEYRHKFLAPEGWSKGLAEQIANIEFATFFDFGNSFGWLVGKEYEIKLKDYFLHLAYSWGFGFRYNLLPIPIRIDFAWPLYDPLLPQNRFIFQNENGLGKIKVHIALGNSF
ncbi:MAG: hypothetical protein HW421_3524 [Ignavibacteria bacterium]|nr:hypothetical protein [Ignavibacteria bacterium]